jgi:parvulin-like peptidyl-prolyl isomerase
MSYARSTTTRVRASSRTARFAVVATLLAAGTSCESKGEVRHSAQPRPIPSFLGETSADKGRWRLAARGELDDVALYFAHILIRHDGVRGDVVPLNIGDWHSDNQITTRTREGARELAQSIARQLRSDSKRFRDLARQFSDDAATRDNGGSISGVRAADLLLWPDVLDALQLAPQGVPSDVVETPFGYHVFINTPPPEPELVAGARLVIGYDKAQRLDAFRRPNHEKIARTRDDALLIATRLLAALRAEPQRFPELVARYSEHKDAARAGDLGLWSSREATTFNRELATLRSLREGEISEPLDTAYGITILRRTAAIPRSNYSAEIVRLAFSSLVPSDHLASKFSREKLANMIIAKASKHSSAIQEAQQMFCCPGVRSWTRGREEPEIESAVSKLGTGEVTPVPVLSEAAWIVARRLAPVQVDPHNHPTTLPSPRQPDVLYAVRTRPARAVVSVVSAISGALETELGASACREYRDFADALGKNLSSEPQAAARIAQFQVFEKDVAKALSAPLFARYVRLRDTYFERLMFGKWALDDAQ